MDYLLISTKILVGLALLAKVLQLVAETGFKINLTVFLSEEKA